jgi:hypothetical protein
VAVEKIMRFLRDERLEITSENANMILACERCSRPITSGRFCRECKDNLGRSLKKEFNIPEGNKVDRDDKPKDKDGDKMFTATRRPRE